MAIDQIESTDHLIRVCAPDVGYNTMKALVVLESGNNPWVIRDNTTKQAFILSSKEETVSKATKLIDQAHNIDIGLAQINSSNLNKLNLSVQQIADPCTNLMASSTILRNFYSQAVKRFFDKQQAVLHTLSAYNTGSFYRGLAYAKKIWDHVDGNNNYIEIKSSNAPYKAPIMVSWKVL
jgi:type IV secretion system protein VirB1